jgi:zinc transport system substrate-binding protein
MSGFIWTGIWQKLVWFWFVGLVVLGLSAGYVQAAPATLTVVTSVPPHAFIVEQLAGEQVKVICLVDQGSDPHTYEPKPKQILAISQAAIFFASGLEFERGLVAKIRAINDKLSIVALASSGTEGHEHEPAHIDQHSWLSPIQYSHQIDIVFEALLERLPAERQAMTRRYGHLKEALSQTEQQVRTLLGPYRGRVFYVFHPAFGHFAEAYGLKQEAVEVGGKLPTAKQLQGIIERSKADRVRVIFAQSQFDQRSAALVAAAISGEIRILDSLAKDVLKNYRTIAASFVESFQ